MLLRVCSSLVLLTSLCWAQEPHCTCSKFHYEEQLLEKMIRTEIKFEELHKKVDAKLTDMSDKYDTFARQEDMRDTRIDKLLTNVNQLAGNHLFLLFASFRSSRLL